MTRKTYIAIHTYISDDAKKQMLTTPYEEDKQTDVEWEKKWTFDKSKCVEAWMGNDDFFFCHWEAEEEEHIHNAFSNPLYICMAGFILLFLTLVILRTRTEILKRKIFILLDHKGR